MHLRDNVVREALEEMKRTHKRHLDEMEQVCHRTIKRIEKIRLANLPATESVDDKFARLRVTTTTTKPVTAKCFDEEVALSEGQMDEQNKRTSSMQKEHTDSRQAMPGVEQHLPDETEQNVDSSDADRTANNGKLGTCITHLEAQQQALAKRVLELDATTGDYNNGIQNLQKLFEEYNDKIRDLKIALVSRSANNDDCQK